MVIFDHAERSAEVKSADACRLATGRVTVGGPQLPAAAKKRWIDLDFANGSGNEPPAYVSVVHSSTLTGASLGHGGIDLHSNPNATEPGGKLGRVDPIPAATLLLPHFQVDLDDPNSLDTRLAVYSATDAPTVAHFTLWTDWGVPTLAFSIYLSGYDVQHVHLRSFFQGYLPRSDHEELQQPDLTPTETEHIRAAHTAEAVTAIGG